MLITVIIEIKINKRNSDMEAKFWESLFFFLKSKRQQKKEIESAIVKLMPFFYQNDNTESWWVIPGSAK